MMGERRNGRGPFGLWMICVAVLGLALSPAVSGRPQISEDEPEEPEERAVELDRFKVAILNELGLSMNEEDLAAFSAAPKANISMDEYTRAYAEYMENVMKRRREERNLGHKERRRNARRVVRTFQGFAESRELEPSQRLGLEGRRIGFNVSLGTGPGVRVKRASAFLPAGCYLGPQEGEAESPASPLDLTNEIVSFLHQSPPSGPFWLSLTCRTSPGGPGAEGSRLRLVTQDHGAASGRPKRSLSAGSSLRNYEGHSGRSRDCDKTRHGKTCCRRSMTISFEELSILDLIVEPKEFDAHMCSGRCNARRLPYATTHAMFQHTLHQTKGKKEIPRPCCTPTKLNHLDVLHILPGTGKLKITILSNAIVEECSCS